MVNMTVKSRPRVPDKCQISCSDSFHYNGAGRAVKLFLFLLVLHRARGYHRINGARTRPLSVQAAMGSFKRIYSDVQDQLHRRLREAFSLYSPPRYPKVRTTAGCGVALLGYACRKECEMFFDHVDAERIRAVLPVSFKVAWYCLFYYPCIPLGIYALRDSPGCRYSFYGRMRFPDALRVLGYGKTLVLAFTSYATGFLSLAAATLAFILL